METKIDSQYNDRCVTVDDARRLRIEGLAHRPFSEVAYLTARGARQLIDALEPLAAPRAEPASPLPVLVGTEWLTGPNPAPTRWRVEYRGYAADAVWRPSTLGSLADRTFASSDAAWAALRPMSADRKRHYRAMPVPAW